MWHHCGTNKEMSFFCTATIVPTKAFIKMTILQFVDARAKICRNRILTEPRRTSFTAHVFVQKIIEQTLQKTRQMKKHSPPLKTTPLLCARARNLTLALSLRLSVSLTLGEARFVDSLFLAATDRLHHWVLRSPRALFCPFGVPPRVAPRVRFLGCLWFLAAQGVQSRRLCPLAFSL